jgi:hypothetical protein
MRTFTNVLGAIVAVSTLMTAQATACPQGYFQCGSVCCPTR